jgi:hypothetical protein
MSRSRMFSKCCKTLSFWTRSFDKYRWLSAGIVSVLTANAQHNTRSRSFDFLFPWASANIPHMGFIAREDYDTGNVIYKIAFLQPSEHFTVFVLVNNFQNCCRHWFHSRTDLDILIFVYYS